MGEQKYPIGIQNFAKLIEGGYTYVDKTEFISSLVSREACYFLSRPRRFGKSLLLSTLHAYFAGRQELFKGLHIYSINRDWDAHPVFHFDLNSEDYSQNEALTQLLDRQLSEYENKYGIDKKDETISGRFARLIKTSFIQTGRRVVILVDEYDKPLLGIEENQNLFSRNQTILKSLFGNLKSMDEYIRFAMITGVARFNKVSIFSDLNNFYDISLSDKYADICGLTEKELLKFFEKGIAELALKRGEGFETTMTNLREFYDGYLFSEEGSYLYNPFSVLLALQNRRIEPYWYETGTPTFLAKRIKKSGIILPDLNKIWCMRSDLTAVGFDTYNPIGLMFQTGYLTIDTYDKKRNRYRLRFPNREVEVGFTTGLYPLYIPRSEISTSPFSIFRFQDDLYDGNPEGFMKRLQTLCKEQIYESNSEDNYRNIVWLLCTLCGTETLAEHHSYKGRSDLEVKTPDFIYIFEFKYNESKQTAMKQLKSRDYAGRLAHDRRITFLIGANFSTKKGTRGLTEWDIERIS